MQVQRENPGVEVTYTPWIFNAALILLEDKVLLMGGSQLKEFGLPRPERTEQVSLSRNMFRETNYNV